MKSTTVTLKLVAICVGTVMLGGCGTVHGWLGNNKTFRNRELDYAHQNLHQIGHLKTPEGLNEPGYNPRHQVHGSSTSLQPLKHVSMKPPTFDDGSAKLQKMQTKAAADKTHLQQMKHSAASQDSSVTGADHAQTDDASAGLFAHPKGQALGSKQDEGNSPQTQSRAHTDKKTAGSKSVWRVDADWHIQGLVKPQAPKQTFDVSMGQSEQGVPYLEVAGNYAQIWLAVQSALDKMGMIVTYRDPTSGYLFIKAKKNQIPVLLYLNAQDAGSKITLYDPKGNPDVTAHADNVLSSVANLLMQ